MFFVLYPPTFAPEPVAESTLHRVSSVPWKYAYPSDVHHWTYLFIHLSLLGAGVDVHNVEFDSFKASTPAGEIEMTNVIAKIPGARPEVVILGRALRHQEDEDAFRRSQ